VRLQGHPELAILPEAQAERSARGWEPRLLQEPSDSVYSCSSHPPQYL